MQRTFRSIMFGLVVLSLAFATGCSNEKATETKPIVVKGLSIGMPVEGLKQIVKDKFGENWQVADIGLAITIQEKDVPFSGSVTHQVITVWQENKRVDSMRIGKECAKRIFRCADMSASDFAKMFAESYGIPNFTVNDGKWEYTTPDNVRIRISADKEVEIAKVSSHGEKKANFN